MSDRERPIPDESDPEPGTGGEDVAESDPEPGTGATARKSDPEPGTG